MNVLLKFLNLVRCFKEFIETNHSTGMIPYILSYSSVREVKMKALEEAIK